MRWGYRVSAPQALTDVAREIAAKWLGHSVGQSGSLFHTK
jgi:hypothetical protein